MPVGYGIFRREGEDPPLHPARACGSCCALRDVPGARDRVCLGYECRRRCDLVGDDQKWRNILIGRRASSRTRNPTRPDFRPGLQPVLLVAERRRHTGFVELRRLGQGVLHDGPRGLQVLRGRSLEQRRDDVLRDAPWHLWPLIT
jgi:hypothetical protein